MTKINKLMMQGFKSFAKKTELVFCNKFNCILGPNGSGKSNVLDALCFVLGKKSSKSLRAEKSANLIYNGGKKKQPAKEATVAIYFDNSDGTFPVDAKDVMVSRTVRPNGSSKYKINKKTVSRQEVVELLSNALINPDGYNIILQGDITQITEMSSIERRKIVEEIAGIAIYEEKKQKALNDLNKVEERLKEADIILVERETYLKELRRERNQAVKFKELNEKIRRNKATAIHLKIEKKEEKKASLAKKIEECKLSIKKQEEKIITINKEIDLKKQEIEAINKEIEEKGDKDQVRIQKDIEELKVKIATDTARSNNCDTEIEKLEERQKHLKESLVELDEKSKRFNMEKKSLLKSIDDKNQLIEKIGEKIKAFKKKYNMDESQNIEKEIDEYDNQAEEKQQVIQELRVSQQNLLREQDRINILIQNADEKISKVLSIEKENKKELERLKQIKQEFKKSTLELNKRLNDDSSLAAQLGNARARLLKANEELSKMQAHRVGLTQKISGNMSVQKILEQKNRIKGIFGTVSMLGEVSGKYSTALEVAAGSKLKSIVVDNDKTAAECISYLKSNKLGVASFLPLNKIKQVSIKPEHKMLLDQHGVHGFAMDLIKFEPKFKNVFSYVFGSTIVVDNINIARKIGIGSSRMATLDGDLCELSGAMHGGFRRKAPGYGFQEREIKEKMDGLENEQADLQNMISQLEKKRLSNEEAIARLRELKANLEGDIVKIEKSLHLDSDDMSMSKNMKKELMEKLKEVDSKLRAVQNDISMHNRELAQVKIKKQGLRAKISALKNPTVIAELNTFEQKRSELKEDIIKLNGDIKTINVQIDTIIGPELANTNKIIKQHEKEHSEFLSERDKLKSSIKKDSKDLDDKEEKQKSFYLKFKELFKKRETVNSDISKLENDNRSTEDKRRGEELKMNSISLDNAKVMAELSGLIEEYKEYDGVPLFKDKDEEHIKREIWQFEKMVRDLGAVNMRALEIYEAVEKEYNQIVAKKEKLTDERQDVLLMINEIETTKKELFMKSYDSLAENFKKIFAELSTKGEAFLELESPEAIFDGGLCLKVRLTGKKFMDIRSLSGGEKTMTALAFLFAVQEYQPAPFYVLDEVDAALDKRNSERLANLVRRYTKKAQYVVISHHDGVISEADNLYGVSMDEHGMSKIVSLKI